MTWLQCGPDVCRIGPSMRLTEAVTSGSKMVGCHPALSIYMHPLLPLPLSGLEEGGREEGILS